MSNQSNTNIYERASELLDIAGEHVEFWDSTTAGKLVDDAMGQVIRHIDNNDLDGLVSVSIPYLEKRIVDSAVEMGRMSQENFHGWDVAV